MEEGLIAFHFAFARLYVLNENSSMSTAAKDYIVRKEKMDMYIVNVYVQATGPSLCYATLRTICVLV